nr:hypothetical protein BaRGS_020476 [Batillaria attramentaria]
MYSPARLTPGHFQHESALDPGLTSSGLKLHCPGAMHFTLCVSFRFKALPRVHDIGAWRQATASMVPGGGIL